MFRLLDREYDRNCQGWCRREFLRIGGLSLLGGLTLPDHLRARAQAASTGRPVRDKSVVLLFLQGGPSHLITIKGRMVTVGADRTVVLPEDEGKWFLASAGIELAQ